MKFIFEKLLTDEQRGVTVCVDGVFESKLQVSHWPGSNSPLEIAADTSTEMAFKLLESTNRDNLLQDIQFVSNNHFDSDGVLAAYVLCYPEKALHHKEMFINIATTGDFSEFTNEEALKIDSVISSIDNPEKTIFQGVFCNPDFKTLLQDIYIKTFNLLPSLLDNLDEYEEYWRENFLWYNNSEASFQNQTSVFSNYGDCSLSIIESPFPLHKISKFAHAEYDIVLSVIKNSEGYLYELEYKTHTWFKTSRPQNIQRRSFEPLAEKLNLIENENKGTWKVLGRDPISEWDYRMQFSDKNFNLVPSKIKVYEIEEILFDYFFE
jgi:hypothetical protein